jgi:hypothetical protein
MPAYAHGIQRMNIKLSLGWFYRAAIIALAVWILHSFVRLCWRRV